MLKSTAIACLGLALLSLACCAPSQGDKKGAQPAPAPVPETKAPDAAPTASAKVDAPSESKSEAKTQKRADGMEITDLEEGKGAVAESGKTVVVHYTGTLTDGTVLEKQVDAPPGHDKNPLTLDGLRAKYDGLVVPALGHERAATLWDQLLRVADNPAPHSLIPALNLTGGEGKRS